MNLTHFFFAEAYAGQKLRARTHIRNYQRPVFMRK